MKHKAPLGEESETQVILVVDDSEQNRLILDAVLSTSYEVVLVASGEEALMRAKEKPRPDLVLLDVMMPVMDGFKVCERLKQDYLTRDIPVIFVTALGDVRDESHGFEVGAVDYITKPVNPAIVRARVKTHLALYDQNRELQRLVRERTREIHETQVAVIERLGRAAEFKDNETGRHVLRMSEYARIIALAAGMNEHDAETLKLAAPMHDIGKIKIPDQILCRSGKLEDDEMELMRGHPEFGADIIGEHHSELLQMARVVALSHHEKWDGSGYPMGLVAEEIPLVARIVAIADVFDALTSRRPYKTAWSIDDALSYIESRAGEHFDPGLTPLLRENLEDVKAVHLRYADDDTASPEPIKMDVNFEALMNLRR
ncbi:MAG: response regulator [Oleiphilaceae bacterium]|nr:response regulator [Oleiphilaceae bacterium]